MAVSSPPVSPFCLIPARGGSKRLPRKNILDVAGMPMIGWTILAAEQSGVFNEIFVSSEDEEILAVAGELGATPLPRPAQLAGDDVPLKDLCVELARWLKAERPTYDSLYMLNATSPLRSVDSIRSAWEKFQQSGALSLVSVTQLHPPPEWALEEVEERLKALDEEGYAKIRQAIPPRYRGDGAQLIATLDALIEHGDFMTPDTAAFHTPEAEAFDVDTEVELELVRLLLAKRMR